MLSPNQYSVSHSSVIKNTIFITKGCRQKNKNSIFKDIIQIEVDPPPSHPIFDKFIFDKVLMMLTSLPPSHRVFDKNHEFLGEAS